MFISEPGPLRRHGGSRTFAPCRSLLWAHLWRGRARVLRGSKTQRRLPSFHLRRLPAVALWRFHFASATSTSLFSGLCKEMLYYQLGQISETMVSPHQMGHGGRLSATGPGAFLNGLCCCHRVRLQEAGLHQVLSRPQTAGPRRPVLSRVSTL